MSFERRQYSDGLTTVEHDGDSSKQLAYTPETKDFIHDNPGVMRKTLDLINEVNKNFKYGSRAEDGDVSVEMKSTWESQPTYKITVGDKCFFLKVRDVGPNSEDQGGFDEVLDIKEAEQLLADVGNIKITNYRLGYTDKKKKYFVSEWSDSHTMGVDEYLGGDYLATRDENYDYEKEKVFNTVREANTVLSRNGYWDIGVDNMAYDPSSRKVVLFDLNKTRSEYDFN